MKTNETGSNEPTNNNLSSEKPTDPTKRETPQKTDPTHEPNPDHTEPKPRKNDPTRISPDKNDPGKTDPTHNTSGKSQKGAQPAEQKEANNDNYTGDHAAKDKSGEKNYTGTSAGFVSGKDTEEEDTTK